MPLSISLAEKEGIETVDLKGRLTLGLEDRIFRKYIEGALAEGKTRIVVNLAGVKEIDDAGVESLITALEKCKKAGGRLALSNVHPAIVEPLTVAKLKASIEVFGSEQEGINSFFPDRCVAPVDLSRLIRQINREKEKYW